MLDPIFNLLAGLLEWFYSLLPSYGFAIIAITTLVLLVLSPLTYRSTKSMMSMRRLQPQIKRLQKKHKGDREKLNQEMMALYQEHNVSPLSGCLPILIQSPVFIVMFRVIRGITRRSSDIGFANGGSFARLADANVTGTVDASGNLPWIPFTENVTRNFNPEYLHREPDNEAQMYLDLVQDNKMDWIGLDLSRTPFEVFQDSIGDSLPYLAMVVLVAFLGWYQQHQMQGRMTGEVSSQQQMIMRIIPWMLPIFSFTMPAGLVLYFIVSAVLRILQQAYITRALYQNEELNKPIEFDGDDDDDDDDDDEEPENPLAALFGGGGSSKKKESKPSNRHGSRRPTGDSASTKNRTRPSRASAELAAKNTKRSTAGSSKASSKPAEKVSGWGRAKRSAPQKNEAPEKPVSRRVTPKGDSSPNRRDKK
jgi:YidC/Oxa1 family membrane protein insertase